MEDALGTVWRLPAPAKLNLFLHVTGVREDGYHNLQTIFQILDYSDEVSLSLRSDGLIRRCSGLTDISEDDDLIVRAARSLQKYTGTSLGANVGVEKRLPVGGGIGGGSSDAATTLLGLNKLWDCQLNQDELIALGAKLGADVPVFINGTSAWAEGIGDQLSELVLPERWYLVIHPGVFISTEKLFSSELLTRDKGILRMRVFPDAGSENVFEPIVRNQYPEVAKSLDWLDNYSPSRLTGTGSCLFASFETEVKAIAVLKKVPKRWNAFIAKAVNKSPVTEALKLCADLK